MIGFLTKDWISLLIAGETPWQLELEGTRRMSKRPDLEVYGTRNRILNYQIMVDKGEFKRDGSWMYPPRQLSDSDFAELDGLGYTPQAVTA